MDKRQIDFLEKDQETNTEQKALKLWRRVFLLSLFAFLLVLAGCITRTILGEYAPNDPSAYDPVTLEPKKPDSLLSRIKQLVFHKDIKLEGEHKDRINLLILGMGGIGHEGPFLTDTIMIASLKPSTNEIAMLSIPRDLAVNIPGYGWRKINNANSFGETEKPNWGAAFATQVIEDTFDIDINYYIRLDFKAFEEIIDEVGGITINVERSFVDHMYPAPNDEYQTVSFQKGVQTMDGQTALIYARSRHGSNDEGSDFARAKRQQKVILALKQKVLSFATLLNPVRINNIVKSLDTHITTNMEFSDIITFAKMARELNTDKIITVVLDNSPDGYLQNAYSPDGAFILEPKTGNFDEINKLVANIFAYEEGQIDDTPVQEKIAADYSYANIEIQNGTWHAGMAARMKKRLQDRNFYISTIGNTNERPQMKSGIFSISEKSYPEILQALQEELHIPIKQTLPDSITAATSTDIMIVLGEDMEE